MSARIIIGRVELEGKALRINKSKTEVFVYDFELNNREINGANNVLKIKDDVIFKMNRFKY